MSYEGWKKYIFSEFVQINPSVRLESTKEYSFVEMKDLNERSKFVYPSTKRKLSGGAKFQNGDTLFARITPCLENGKICQVKGLESGVGFGSTEFLVFRGKEDVSDSDFVFYLSRYTEVRLFAEQNMLGTSGRQRVTWDTFDNLELKLPPLPTQRRIASILSALDDKIELNRQTNQTLEAIAQAIYKEWLVNFRFPPSPLEGCPKGGVDSSPLEGWQAKPDGVDSFLRPCPKAVNSLQATPTSPASWQKNSLFPFWTLPKNRKLQERAKELRKQGILSEVIFWKTFKDKKKLGWDIDRQVIIGNFIVDFFIPELGLVFEIDGSSHNDKQEYDRERDAFLSSLQLKVVRIFGKDVLGNIEGVWSFVTRSIKERVEELSPPRPSGTPQEGKSPPRQASPATPQEGKKCEMQDSELGPIPKGWRVGKLGEIYKTTSGGTPSRSKPEFYENGTIYWVKSKELNGSFITETEEKITQEALQKSSAKLLPAYSVLIAMYGATVGEFGIISMEATCNQAICAFLSCEEFPYTLYLPLLEKQQRRYYLKSRWLCTAKH